MRVEEILFAAAVIFMMVALCSPYFWQSFVARMNAHFETTGNDNIYYFEITNQDDEKWYGYVIEKGEKKFGFVDKNQEMPDGSKHEDEDLRIGDAITVYFYRYIAKTEQSHFCRI